MEYKTKISDILKLRANLKNSSEAKTEYAETLIIFEYQSTSQEVRSIDDYIDKTFLIFFFRLIHEISNKQIRLVFFMIKNASYF